MIRLSPGGGNFAVKVLCTADLRVDVEVHIFNYLKHQFIYYCRKISQVNGGKVTRRKRWPADPIPEQIISMVMLDYQSLSK